MREKPPPDFTHELRGFIEDEQSYQEINHFHEKLLIESSHIIHRPDSFIIESESLPDFPLKTLEPVDHRGPSGIAISE
jgi:hypothetical protein